MLFFCFSLYPLLSQTAPCDDTVPFLGFDLAITSSNTSGEIMPGDEFCIDFLAVNFNDISTFSFVLNYDPGVILYDRNIPPMASAALGSSVIGNTDRIDEGILNLLWFDDFGLTVTIPDGEVVMSVCFEAQDAAGECSFIDDINGSIFNPSFPTLVQVGTDVNIACVMDTIVFNNSDTEICVGCDGVSVIDLILCESSGGLAFGACSNDFPVQVSVIPSSGPTLQATLTGINDRTTFANLPAGDYLIELVDMQGNRNGINDFFQIDRSAPELNTTVVSNNPRCAGLNNGSIDYEVVSAAPGANYVFSLSNGLFSESDRSGTFENLVNGIYSLTVTDETGCTMVTDNIELFTPPIEVNATVDEFACLFDTAGMMVITPP